ncbi:hypothetical protein, conserved [Babesia ovata]|uniref:Uncharacterized protein n=1 Tax=Babesia ovata TaxID=189622 RepID=A0A2H6KGK8_9APIC|nr:uncharacterized protein BOVATA_036210 [Babesia ovata]GBE62128.1 hypothetical protein, conserved [Babesia ovata]
MASQRDEREMKAPAGGDNKRDLAVSVSTCPDKDGAEERRTDKLEQMKEWKNRFDEFVSYTHTVLNDVLGYTRPDATSELNSRPVNSPSGNGGSRCSPQQRTLGADPPSIQSSSQTAPEKDPKSTGSNKPPSVTDPKRRVYTSLTEPPRNVRQCMDWLIALKGKDGTKNIKALGEVVYGFLADKPVGYTRVPALEEIKEIVKQFLKQKHIRGEPSIREMLSKYETLRSLGDPCIDCFFYIEEHYENIIQTKRITAIYIAESLTDLVKGCENFLEGIKNPDQYISAYSPDATWDVKCAKDLEAYAIIFVGIAPMLYAGLLSVMIECWNARWGCPTLIRSKRLLQILNDLGYVEPECRSKITPAVIDRALSRLDYHELGTLYNLSGFWAFYDFQNYSSTDASSSGHESSGSCKTVEADQHEQSLCPAPQSVAVNELSRNICNL